MRRCFLIALLIVWPAATPARAELNGCDTLELRVARATTVVHATVGDSRTLLVLETIKGRPQETIRLDPSDNSLRGFVEGERVLAFLDSEGKPIPSTEDSGVYHFSVSRTRLPTIDWNSTRDSEQTIESAKDAAKWPAPAKAIAIQAPSGGSYVRFPVDQPLERAAQHWPQPIYAAQAAQALREFRSKENAAILRRLLDERSEFTMQGAGRLWSLSYPVPDLAWHTLESWGEHVPRPVMTLPDDYYRDLRWHHIILAIALLLAPAGVALIVVTKRKPLVAVATLLGTLTLLMIVSWSRSGEIVDELFVDRADRQLWISSVDGWFQITRIPDWRGRVARDRYVPLGEELDGLVAADVESATPHLQPPRGWMIGAIPFQPMRQLWFGPPTRVTRDDDWHIAKVLSGFDVTTYGPDKPPLAVQRFQIRWVVLIAAFGTWPAAWIGIGVYRELRSRRRRARGRCVGCGYDLRGSDNAGGGRCPECGLTFSS